MSYIFLLPVLPEMLVFTVEQQIGRGKSDSGCNTNFTVQHLHENYTRALVKNSELKSELQWIPKIVSSL